MRVDVVYGPGGHDPSKPDNNIISSVEVDEAEPEMTEFESALAKLQALGLTEAEALALVGGL